MAKRYELSDEDWTMVADLFIEIHGWARLRLMLDVVLWVVFSRSR
ncbi:hypothetical protein PMI30_05178 [Pseudomonas sp. GM50]|jgi:hypothetical protein|nr:hypothetical protein PMI30_05178 [Pseudomonas sp. GM50]